MKFLLDWINSFDDCATVWRGDEHVFHLTLQHQENCFAAAKATLVNSRLSQLDCVRKRYARIGIQWGDGSDVQPIFFGCVTAVPTRIGKNLTVLELLSRPDDAFEKFERLKARLKNSPVWDELFVPESRQDDPTYLLEGISGLYYWDKVTGELSVSDINFGREHRVINRTTSADIDLKFCSDPLDSINIRVQVEWIQKAQGILDLSRFISKNFADGIINSFTGNDLKQRFRRLHYGIKNSAYKLLRCDVKESDVKGAPSFYPEYSRLFEVTDGSGGKRSIRFRRHWFDCDCLLYWKYRQKRREIANITLENSFQRIRNACPNRKTINIKLRSIALRSDVLPWMGHTFYAADSQVAFGGYVYVCVQAHRSGNSFVPDQDKWHCTGKIPSAMPDASSASFFLTPRGQLAVMHAVMMARAHLAWSTRCIEVTFRGSVEDFASITLDMHVTLNCQDLPGGSVTGKVIKTLLFADGKTGRQYVDITIACSVGKARHGVHLELDKHTEPLINYADQNYANDEIFVRGDKLSIQDVSIPDFTSKAKIDGILAPSLMDIADLVDDVRIANSPEEQESVMNSVMHLRSVDALKQALNHSRTQIYLKLRNINHKMTLEHEVNVTAQTSWSAPEGVKID
ncbi:MAG: hypothetical protein LBJ03_02130 [Holosporales bacterium]|jgi:hypothetical protein|nr:hypothetical protein [Holosporales bacterium]